MYESRRVAAFDEDKAKVVAFLLHSKGKRLWRLSESIAVNIAELACTSVDQVSPCISAWPYWAAVARGPRSRQTQWHCRTAALSHTVSVYSTISTKYLSTPWHLCTVN